MTKNSIIPSRQFIRSRKAKIERMSILCYKNSLRLHEDAIYLFKKGKYPSAYALSIIALEEMSKHKTLSHGLFYEWFDVIQEDKILKNISRDSVDFNDVIREHESFISNVIKDTYSHKSKQQAFFNSNWLEIVYEDMELLNDQERGAAWEYLRKNFSPDIDRYLDDPVFAKYFPKLRRQQKRLIALEENKQNAFYVGYPKKKGNADFEKKLSSPFRIGKKRAEEQITQLNDHILLKALQVLKGVSGFEVYEDELDDMITSSYVKKLWKNWPKVGKRNKSLFTKLSKMSDDKHSDEESVDVANALTAERYEYYQKQKGEVGN